MISIEEKENSWYNKVKFRKEFFMPNEHKTNDTERTSPKATLFMDDSPFGKKKKDEEKKKTKKEPVEQQIHLYHPGESGLTHTQVRMHQAEGLVNTAPKKYSKTYSKIFKDNILTFFNLLCVFCAVALFIAKAEASQFLFVPIFLLNIGIGIFQEIRSKLKIDKLTILNEPHTTVVRSGKEEEIPTEEIVLEDVLVLSIGQQIPADCTLLSGHVEVNESLLTGESISIKKGIGDTLYAGSFLTSGKCKVRVEKIGNDTYISKLTSQAKQYKKPKSEIMNSITLFIRVITFLLVPITAAMYYRNWTALCNGFNDTISKALSAMNVPFEFLTPHEIFRIAFSSEESLPIIFTRLYGEGCYFANATELISACRSVFNDSIQRTASVVIGMIPSGLMLLTSFTLAVGVMRLAQHNTLVQDLYSLEMLARVNVLCLDKTGTITDGQMCVADVKAVTEETYPISSIISSMLDVLPDNNQTSIALHNRFGHSADYLSKSFIPFSSARKFSAVTFDTIGTFALGAPEFILHPVPKHIEKLIREYAQKGMRVILLAHSNNSIEKEIPPTDFKAYALVALEDNIRADAIKTIQWFKENDVEIKVISGDNPITVSEVARRAGIEGAEKYISLEGLSQLEIEMVANDYTVFGRVTPEQKAILVHQLKASGDTVAMTGDGVNDILAMKEADCAISVASGSEAARNVSNIVLMDNNFSNMPKVVFEGRRVINNVKNSASLYLMKTLLTAILAIFCLVTGHSYFFKTSNLLLFEMFIAGIPSIFLSLQPNTERVHGKFITYVISRAFPGAFTIALAVLAMYFTSTPIFQKLFKIGGFTGIFIGNGAELIELGEAFKAHYLALAFVALTFSGSVMLYRLCSPFNIMRGTLWGVSTFLCFLLTITIGDFFFIGWSSIHFSFPELLYLVFIIVISFPVSKGLIFFFEKLNAK